MKIHLLSKDETIQYAGEELKKYLEQMDPRISAVIDFEDAEDGIRLGLLSQLRLDAADVEDPMIDDVIDVSVADMQGYIGGSNGRSVLMGVYDYLKSAGCQWLRPGEKGEYIPQKDMANHRFSFRKKADFAFRGQCIEGAVSFENIRDTILFLPKIHMNLFMLEQVVPYNYISRWYKHSASTTKKDEQVSFEEISAFIPLLEKEIKKCGLQYHALGHGYLLEPYGIHYKTWADTYVLTEEAKEDVALVNGKRELYQGSPNFTQLCFSKDKARKGLVNFLVEYVEKKPIDFLHVWLSDAANNQCECENCQKKIPTDFYVQMLNELDAELTKRNRDTKIVFIMYVDTFWAPEVEKLNNPSRFIMTLAPARDYSIPYSMARYQGELPPYRRNQFNLSADFSMNLAFMDRWKPAFDGKRFLFEYRFYTDHYFDPGYMQIARESMQDISSLPESEFQGIMNDQTQRSYFPTGLPIAVTGEGLFDKNMDFDAFCHDYMQAAFGEDAPLATAYLEQITETFAPSTLRLKDTVVSQDTNTGECTVTGGIKNNADAAKRLEAVRNITGSFAQVVEKNLSVQNPCHRDSWNMLKYHLEYCNRLADIYIALGYGDIEKAKTLLAETMDYLSHIEDEIQPYFDMVLFKQRIGQVINK